MAYTNNLTEETKALLNGNNPIVYGASQYIAQATPRLSKQLSTNTANYQPLYTQNGQTTTSENNTLSDLSNIGGSIASLAKTWGNSGGANGYGGLISGGINGLKSFAKSGDYKDGLQGAFGVDSKEDSDVMQAIKGTINGATTGSAFSPIGAAIGGVLGLGSSFLDDI